MGNLRSKENYANSFWDWSHFNGCFGSEKRKVTDVDGGIERHGYYLFFETKSLWDTIPMGQSIFYEGQVNAGNSVLFIWGNTNDPRKAYYVTPTRSTIYNPADWATLREIATGWYEWANKQPKKFVYRGRCEMPKELRFQPKRRGLAV